MISHHLASNSWTIRMDKGSGAVTSVTYAFDLGCGLRVVFEQRGTELTPGTTFSSTDSTTELESGLLMKIPPPDLIKTLRTAPATVAGITLVRKSLKIQRPEPLPCRRRPMSTLANRAIKRSINTLKKGVVQRINWRTGSRWRLNQNLEMVPQRSNLSREGIHV
jgi:hypothetical protein